MSRALILEAALPEAEARGRSQSGLGEAGRESEAGSERSKAGRSEAARGRSETGRGRSDAELVAAIRDAGDERAFRELYRRHTPRLYQFVLRLLGGREQDAEDVLQEAWLRATTGLAGFRWQSAFGTWLTGIGLNQVKDHLRRQGRRPVCDGRPDEILGSVRAAAALAPERIDLERALALLPDGYRTVFVLHDVEGFGHAEIAAQLEIAEGTSKSQLFHARRTLRALLEPVGSKEAGHDG